MTLHMKAMEDHAVQSRKVPKTIRLASCGLDTSGEEASGEGPTGDRNPLEEDRTEEAEERRGREAEEL